MGNTKTGHSKEFSWWDIEKLIEQAANRPQKNLKFAVHLLSDDWKRVLEVLREQG